MSTKIIGNQIDASTRAIMEALSVTEQINLPALNTAAVTALGTPAFGTVVYNSTEDAAQIYKADAQQGVPGWTTIGGGGPAVGNNSIIRTNGTTIEENLTIGPTANGGVEFTNGFSAGPITIANGFTVTIENNATWNIIGGEDQMNLEVNAIMAGDIRSTGLLHFSETKESIKYYVSSGDVTHDFNAHNVIYVTRTGGSDWTLNLNNVPNGDGHGFGFTVICENGGGAGAPVALNVDGTATPITWSGGTAPGHTDTYLICSFALIDKIPASPAGNEEYVVFGSAGAFT
tara:strand:- start:341 stop:1204 length:864 start_codon:yes stop_codon:yes gene_type:complete